MNVTRGIRNNNPGNLRWNEKIHWQGQISRDSAGYAIFDSMPHGVRALAINLTNAIRAGYNTPRKLIEHFAPSTENPTEAYIQFICKMTGLQQDGTIDEKLVDTLTDLISRFECGDWLDPADLVQGLAMAASHFLQQQKQQESSHE